MELAKLILAGYEANIMSLGKWLNPIYAGKKSLKILGGLFGGGKNKALDQAEENERIRQAEIDAGYKKIEGIFSSPERNQQIEDFIGSQRGLLQSDLNREKGKQDRELKFSLARSGLSGGSTDIDQNRQLSELYLRGIAESERRAQNSGAELRSQDQQQKQNLMSSVLAGGDITTGANNAIAMMRNNTALARTDSTFGNFDSLFRDFGNIYKNSRESAGERKANKNMNFGTLFTPSAQQGGQVAGGI